MIFHERMNTIKLERIRSENIEIKKSGTKMKIERVEIKKWNEERRVESIPMCLDDEWRSKQGRSRKWFSGVEDGGGGVFVFFGEKDEKKNGN